MSQECSSTSQSFLWEPLQAQKTSVVLMSRPQRRLEWTNIIYNQAESEAQKNPWIKQQNENRILPVFPPWETGEGLSSAASRAWRPAVARNMTFGKSGRQILFIFFKLKRKVKFKNCCSKKQKNKVDEEFLGNGEASSSGVTILASSIRQIQADVKGSFCTLIASYF